MSEQMPAGWKVGDPLPDNHPWRAAALRRYAGYANARSALVYRNRAKPLERDRFEMRLRPEARAYINAFIRDLGWTATEVVEYAIADAHRRIYGGALPAPDEVRALDAGDAADRADALPWDDEEEPDREAWPWDDEGEVA